MISFFNRANPFFGVCLFCIYVRNKIYVMEIEMFEPVLMARNLHVFGSLKFRSIPLHITSLSVRLLFEKRIGSILNQKN
jgi:hypothetical protein